MTILVRLLTLLTIAAAGFALPMTCAQDGSPASAEPISIDIPTAQQLESNPADAVHLSEAQKTVATLVHRALDQAPFNCGKTAPRVAEHPATFDTQPFVPGYLGSTLLFFDDRAQSFAPPAELIPIESRAGPPDAPPPKSID